MKNFAIIALYLACYVFLPGLAYSGIERVLPLVRQIRPLLLIQRNDYLGSGFIISCKVTNSYVRGDQVSCHLASIIPSQLTMQTLNNLNRFPISTLNSLGMNNLYTSFSSVNEGTWASNHQSSNFEETETEVFYPNTLSLFSFFTPNIANRPPITLLSPIYPDYSNHALQYGGVIENSEPDPDQSFAVYFTPANAEELSSIPLAKPSFRGLHNNLPDGSMYAIFNQFGVLNILQWPLVNGYFVFQNIIFFIKEYIDSKSCSQQAYSIYNGHYKKPDDDQPPPACF